MEKQAEVKESSTCIVRSVFYTYHKTIDELIDLLNESIPTGAMVNLRILTTNKFQAGKMAALMKVAIRYDMPVLVNEIVVAEHLNSRYNELYPDAKREKIFYAYNSPVTRREAASSEQFERGVLCSDTLTADQMYEFTSLTSTVIAGGFVGLT